MVLEECDGLHLIKLLKERLDSDGFLEALLVLRTLWLRRNEHVFQGKFHPPSQIILKFKNMAAECAETPQEEPTGSAAVVNIPSNRRAPRVGWLKLDWTQLLIICQGKWA
jgi:hypothetical protein